MAIVGSRAATAYGAHIATQIAASLSGQGWAIVSGAAYGIDESSVLPSKLPSTEITVVPVVNTYASTTLVNPVVSIQPDTSGEAAVVSGTVFSHSL